MMRMYLNYDIDMRKSPILVYPTLHYQNGGLGSAATDSQRLSVTCSLQARLSAAFTAATV